MATTKKTRRPGRPRKSVRSSRPKVDRDQATLKTPGIFNPSRKTIDDAAANLRALLKDVSGGDPYIPQSWVVHFAGCSPQAVSRAVGEKRIKARRFTFPDSHGVILVRLEDVREWAGRLAWRRGVLG